MTTYKLKIKKPTGHFARINATEFYIMEGKVFVGKIYKDEKGYYISLAVVKTEALNDNKNPNCKWMWIKLKNRFDDMKSAVDFMNENCEAINKSFTLHKLEL